MGLFDLIPKLKGLPPELLQLLSNPGELGKQVKAFYGAASRLLSAIEAHKQSAEVIATIEDYPENLEAAAAAAEAMAYADTAVWEAADAFRVELNKLPPLDTVTT
jgi:hypothetical protein